jgi:hypothetical protein
MNPIVEDKTNLKEYSTMKFTIANTTIAILEIELRSRITMEAKIKMFPTMITVRYSTNVMENALIRPTRPKLDRSSRRIQSRTIRNERIL